MDTAIKILMAVVIGALVLAGLYALIGETVLPTLKQRVVDMFNYGKYLLLLLQGSFLIALLTIVSLWISENGHSRPPLPLHCFDFPSFFHTTEKLFGCFLRELFCSLPPSYGAAAM